jgi:hypothetical protein
VTGDGPEGGANGFNMPPGTAVIAGEAPLKGTMVILAPVILLMISTIK